MRRRSGLGLVFGLLLVVGPVAGTPPAAPPGLVSVTVLTDASDQFGGFSAIHLLAGGHEFLAVSDRGTIQRATFRRDASGRITDIALGRILVLRNQHGVRLSGPEGDSEGMALGPDNRMCVSFEILIRVICYDPLTGNARQLPQNPAFAQLPDNGALEALAVDGTGALFTVPEYPAGPDLPVYVFRNDAWQPTSLHLPRSGGFHPVAADFGPDGRFYLLERRFHGLRGFSSRLRRFDLGTDGFSPGITLLQTPVGLHDNLEGLSVWRAPDGLRATMISDDNFLSVQVTEVVEYRLPD